MASPGTDEPSGAFLRRVFAAASLTVFVVALALALWAVRDVLLLGFAGLLLAIILSGAANWIAWHTPLSRGLAIGVVLLLAAGLLALGVSYVVPVLQDQIEQLADALPKAFDQVQQRLSTVSWLREALAGARAQAAKIVPGLLSGTLGGLSGLVVVLAVGIYLAAEPCQYRDGLIRLFPRTARPRAGEVLDAVGQTLRWFLVGQLVAMVCVGAAIGIGLTLIGVPHAAALGILAGVLEFIPFLGPILSFVPAEIIALGQSPTLGLWVVLLWTVVQQTENHLLIPIVQSKAVSLPPAVTILGLVAFGSLFGFLGLLLGTPLAAVVLEVTRRLYLRDTLGDLEEARREAEVRAAEGS